MTDSFFELEEDKFEDTSIMRNKELSYRYGQ